MTLNLTFIVVIKEENNTFNDETGIIVNERVL